MKININELSKTEADYIFLCIELLDSKKLDSKILEKLKKLSKEEIEKRLFND